MVGLIIGVIYIFEDQNKLPSWYWPAFNALLLIPAFYAAIAVHEMGHLVLGLLAGLDMGGIAVGGFLLLKSGKNWVFRFDRMWIGGGFFKPLTKATNFRASRCAWMVAGGPLASSALTIVCRVISVQYGSGTWDWIGSLFWISLFTALFSMFPFAVGLYKSDGALLRMLIRHPDQAASWMAMLELQTAEAKGLRPREWDAGAFGQMLTVDAAASEYPYCQLMAFYRRLDEQSEPAALEHLENVLATSARSGKPLRHAAFLEAASSSAIIRKQAGQARTWRDRACKLRRPDSLDVIEAGIAMCEMRYEEAARYWEAARTRVAQRRLDSGLIRFAKEKWAEYETACRASL